MTNIDPEQLAAVVAAAVVQAMSSIQGEDDSGSVPTESPEADNPGMTQKPTIYDLKAGRQTGQNLFDTGHDDIQKRNRTTETEKKMYGEYVPPPARRVTKIKSICKNCGTEEQVVAAQVSAVKYEDGYKHMCTKCSRGRGKRRSR